MNKQISRLEHFLRGRRGEISLVKGKYILLKCIRFDFPTR